LRKSPQRNHRSSLMRYLFFSLFFFNAICGYAEKPLTRDEFALPNREVVYAISNH